MPALDRDLLLSILSEPCAPFREGRVIARLRAILDEACVPYFADTIGNLVLGARDAREYAALTREKTTEPLRVFIAHLDHPGFHGRKWISDTELEVEWHGGSPNAFIDGAKVWLADAKGSIGEGRFSAVKMTPSGRSIDSGTIRVDAGLRSSHSGPGSIFGGFAFRSPVWQEGKLLYTKAADDLVGAYAITQLAIEHFGVRRSGSSSRSRKKPASRKKRPPFLGLLTRAEEVGFIGAIGHFELGWLTRSKRPVLCVSLETSRTLPGADIGKGPVVRLGDRATVFDQKALRVFTQLATEVLPERHQRRIMDGGSCEATAATAYGLRSIGISVPLGNYHNQSFEGGPDAAGPSGPAPEFVSLDDVEGLLTLCDALLKPKLPWDDAWKPRVAEFRKELKKYRPLLKSGP